MPSRKTRTEGFGVNTPDLLLASFVINMLSLALPLLTLQVYDRIIPNPDSGTLPILIGGVCVAVLLETILRLARARMIGWNGACFDHVLSCQAVDHMMKVELDSFGRDGAGSYLNSLTAINRLKDFCNGQATITVFELLFVPLFLALIWYIAGALVLAPIGILFLFTATSFLYGRSLKDALIQRDHADDERYNFMIEALSGIHTLKSFALENVFQRRYEALEKRSTYTNFDVTQAAAGTFNAGIMYSHASLVITISAGAILVLNGEISSGALIAVILLSGRIMQPVQRALALWTRYQDYNVAQEKLDRIFSAPVHVPATLSQNPAQTGRLSIRDAGRRRRDGEGWLFEHVSLSLSKGEVIRISGKHGCGRTTLLRMIAGLYSPDAGTVTVDGVPAHDLPPSLRAGHVGLVTTRAVIFHGTIRDNITRFGASAEAHARDAVQLLGLSRDIAGLPQGFDTMLEGMDSDTVSPGLLQRIAMARVLAARPGIILFDNADRDLDREGYRQVYQMIGALRERAAVILITDDLNLGRMADRHFRLNADGLQPVQDFHEGVMYGELKA